MLSNYLIRCKICEDKVSIKQGLQIICQPHLLQNFRNKGFKFKWILHQYVILSVCECVMSHLSSTSIKKCALNLHIEPARSRHYIT